MNGNYKIEVPHFYCLEYYEDMRKMTIEIDFREEKIFLSANMIEKWEKPYDKEIIGKADKKRIINNIYDCLLKNNSVERICLEED